MVIMGASISSPQTETTALCWAPQSLLLSTVIVLSQSIEINQSPEKKSRQGLIGASAVAWENENNQL